MEDEEKSVAENRIYGTPVGTGLREEKALLFYHEMSSLAQRFLLRVPHSLESFTAGKYIRILEQGKRGGKGGPDASLAAFTMDNVFMSLQKAYSDYYMIRCKFTDPWIGETK